MVKIITEGGQATGLRISFDDQDYTITNYHVIDGYRTVGVQFHPAIAKQQDTKDEALFFIGEVVKVDETKDLAAITLPKTNSALKPLDTNPTDQSTIIVLLIITEA